MNQYVVDTHSLFWYRMGSPRLSAAAKAALDDGAAGKATVFIPAIVLAELFYLNEKLGRPLDFTTEYNVLNATGLFELLAFDPADVLRFDSTSAVPEMHDRIIVVTALKTGSACITVDAAIAKSGLVSVVW